MIAISNATSDAQPRMKLFLRMTRWPTQRGRNDNENKQCLRRETAHAVVILQATNYAVSSAFYFERQAVVAAGVTSTAGRTAFFAAVNGGSAASVLVVQVRMRYPLGKRLLLDLGAPATGTGTMSARHGERHWNARWHSCFQCQLSGCFTCQLFGCTHVRGRRKPWKCLLHRVFASIHLQSEHMLQRTSQSTLRQTVNGSSRGMAASALRCRRCC